jgi:hypothetical protein
MKIRSWLFAAVMALLLEGCIQPEIVRESAVPENTVQVRSLVIAVDDSMISPTLFGRFGRAYVDAMEAALKDNEGDVPVSLVTTNETQLHDAVARAVISKKPSQLMRLRIVAVTSQSEKPISLIWQLDLMDVKVEPLDVSTNPGKFHLTYKAIYRVQLTGPVCIDGLLNAQNEVAACGQQMGEGFAKRLREVHVTTHASTAVPRPTGEAMAVGK